MARIARLLCEGRAEHLGLGATRPRFSWWIDDSTPNALQSAYEIQVADTAEFRALVWKSGEVLSARSVLVEYNGPPLSDATRYWYRVRVRTALAERQWSEWKADWFETALGEWRASWIAPDDDGDGGTGEESRGEPHDENRRGRDFPGAGGPPPYLRREFDAPPHLTAARLYVAARGLAEITINGARVGNDRFVPGWSDYDRRCQFITYDVGSLIVPGPNVIGAIAGDGWYSGRIARINDGERRFGSRPQILCEIHLRQERGDCVVVGTDGSWQWRTGAIVSSDIYDGEHYDARLEIPGWDRPGASDDGWRPVRVVGPAAAGWRGPGRSTVAPILEAKVAPPVRPVEELAPVAVSEPAPGRFVYDLGQNISGWVRIRLAGHPGMKVTLRFAEMLNADGTLYVENLRSAKATDSYTFKESAEISWEPRFTFHGFRHVELSGLEAAPGSERITGIVVHSDMEPTGSFACSHPGVNSLASNIRWGLRGNYLDVPTDCPQRDERLGWTGDAQVFIPTASFLYDVSSFFNKWLRDLRDAQGPAGTVPSVAPAVRYMKPDDENDGGPAWSDAMVICPWTIYRRFGDRRIIEESFDAMLAFVESMRTRSHGLIRADERFEERTGYGDWVAMDAPEGSRVGATPVDLIGTAYFAHSADLLARMARVIGRLDDATRLAALHRDVVAAFQAEYVTRSGRVLGDTQTAYAIALAFDLLPDALRQSALERLVRKLERRGWRLATGFVGTPLLCPVLTRFGRADVAYRLLLQEEYPSWLYTVNQGATTMWERWNSYTKESGFGPVSMNSFNHYAYGAIGDWIYRTVGGIGVDFTLDPPIRIAPVPGYGITRARAELATPFGIASSEWRIEGDVVSLSVVIPANATALVELPAHDVAASRVTDRGETHPGVTKRGDAPPLPEDRPGGGRPCYAVGAGAYRFSWKEISATGRQAGSGEVG